MRASRPKKVRRAPSWTQPLQPAAALLVILTVVLGGCLDQRAPRLELSSGAELVMSSTRSSLVVHNAGGRILEWNVESDDWRVSLKPSGGRLFASGTSTVNIEVVAGIVDKNEVFSATLLFRSNGGDQELLLRLSPDSGIGRCADHLPYELPLKTGFTAARSALPGAGAVPVGNEILVGYRELSSELFGDLSSDGGPEPFLVPRSDGLQQVGFEHAAPQPPAPDQTARPRPYAGPQTHAAAALVTARLRAELQTDLGMTLLRAGVGAAPDLYRTVGEPETVIARLLEDPRVAYAQRNYYLELLASPDDPELLNKQWNLMAFGVPEAWEIYDGSTAADDIVLAIVDSGIYGEHPDLAVKLLPGWDFNGRDADTNPGEPTDDNDAAHGTHVAGIAAAIGDNGIGIAGVAYGAAVRLLPVKVFNDVGAGGSIAGLVDAIRWAAGLAINGVPVNAHPATVINMSLGVAGTHPAVEAAVLDAWNAGSLLVAAAGNHNTANPDRGVLSPANAPCVIAVGSVDGDRQVSTFSNHGPEMELLAPGGFASSGCGSVYSTVPPTPVEGNPSLAIYGCLAGTSMAAPFVAGVAALLFGQGELTTPAEVRNRLSETALPASPADDTAYYGNGLVCADAALGAATICGLPPKLSEAAALR